MKGFRQMRQTLAALFAALFLLAVPLTTLAEAGSDEREDAAIVQAFEDGFTLTLPAGWLSYSLEAEQAAEGLTYLLSDASGAHYLLISGAPSQLTENHALFQAMQTYPDAREEVYDGTEFVTYTGEDTFGAATLLDGVAWNFLFTGMRADAAFASLAEEILMSFAPAAADGEGE